MDRVSNLPPEVKAITLALTFRHFFKVERVSSVFPE